MLETDEPRVVARPFLVTLEPTALLELPELDVDNALAQAKHTREVSDLSPVPSGGVEEHQDRAARWELAELRELALGQHRAPPVVACSAGMLRSVPLGGATHSEGTCAALARADSCRASVARMTRARAPKQ